MKTKQNQSTSKSAENLAKGICVAILAAALPLSAQVVIEAGPGTVQASDQDGEVEPVTAPVNPDVEPLQAAPRGPVKEIDGSITVRPNQLESTTVNVPMKSEPRTPIADVEPSPIAVDPTTTTTAEVPAPRETVSPEVAERMAELAREFSIQASSAGAALGMTTEGLYTEGTSEIDPLLESQLSGIAEYIRLSQNEVVEVTYHYVPDETSEDLAWKRSLALVNWMKKKGMTTQQVYKISEPRAVVIETPDLTSPDSVTDTELVGRIELSMN